MAARVPPLLLLPLVAEHCMEGAISLVGGVADERGAGQREDSLHNGPSGGASRAPVAPSKLRRLDFFQCVE